MSKPDIWAHRGADGYAPENTIPAFAMAVEMGADGVELDVQLSKDGQIVVCHDEKIDRCSNGKGWVKDYTLEELKKFDFSGGDKNYAGVQIPTLEEVLDLLQDTGLYVDIELKTLACPYLGIEKKCVELVREKGYADRVIVTSFNHLSLQKIRLYAPEIRRGYLYLHAAAKIIPLAKKLGVDALNITHRNLKAEGFVDQCRENNLQINAWTVNKKEELLLCMEHGVNAVITDYPDQIRKILDEMEQE